MTQDEQEAGSFRYVAPRVFVLSSGNIAVCHMIGRLPPQIYTPAEFSIACLPTMEDLDEQSRLADAAQRARAASLTTVRIQPKATLDDLA
jgi:hypothetical protein